MDFWGTVGSTVIALLIVAAITTAAGWIAVSSRRWWTNRAVFVLKPELGNQWILRNATRRTLFEVRYSLYDPVNGEQFGSGHLGLMPDAPPDAGATVDAQPGRVLTIGYIDRVRRVAFITLEEGKDIYRIRPDKIRKRRLGWTTS